MRGWPFWRRRVRRQVLRRFDSSTSCNLSSVLALWDLDGVICFFRDGSFLMLIWYSVARSFLQWSHRTIHFTIDRCMVYGMERVVT